jgi:AraC-like DNA-binding protein
MAKCGTATFADPAEYGASIGGARVNITVIGGGDFNARLTWLNLDHVFLFHARENIPRIGFFSLSPQQAFVSFPTNTASLVTYGGSVLQFGDLVFHSRGERAHQRTNGKSEWGIISFSYERFLASVEALTGTNIMSPQESRVLRPSRGEASRFLRLHSKICRLVETRQELITNPEVARALEQELLQALISCLTVEEAGSHSKRNRHHAEIMVRFENALASYREPHLNLPAICSVIDVPERTLRMCSAELLGLSPARYHLLRRLNRARFELLYADPETASVTQIAHNHQFVELGRFAVAYRTVFGEMPSFTLRRSSIKRA